MSWKYPLGSKVTRTVGSETRTLVVLGQVSGGPWYLLEFDSPETVPSKEFCEALDLCRDVPQMWTVSKSKFEGVK